MKTGKLLLCAAVSATMMGAAPAYAAYPDQPLRIVVGYAAGGTTDILARALGEQLAEELGTSVVIENKPGAAGSIAAAYVQNAKPDGYTVFIATVSSHGMNPALYNKLNYDPVKGFAPISMLASIPLVLVTDPKLKFKSVAELVETARAKPGVLNYSSSGNGSPVHIAGAMFADQAKLDIVHVPYKGGAPANMAVMSGDAQFTFATLPAALPQVKGGKLDALAVTTKQRSTELPEVPTMAEDKNFTGYEINTWNALLAPAGTPDDVIQVLNKAVTKVMGAGKLQESFRREGALPQSSTPEELKAFIDQQLKYWHDVVKKLNIHLS
ncbi:Bug family tripartite tricarboxylate transporter substrate binding protein [Parapusillimonas granuli]|uniref:Tripartite tricarboxylate transporter substrate binding protein n=1 Tax=Parapusillimonas granuli TaxID=380911 RepID=A0A853G9A9_9BURK|nr:tripartite tricarboxylate transporter substrate binding protein [Parapusillimonas granuli]MBB5216453.1 tripartite-type tricarboxylate transporter receptor subunit TctC [Parapusillimonas granuli]MEB2399804.1 tripartite tricarboxylate transporter substrate binding protein [Alcaligenaceae bacterium]NYT51520.1 tripartite tricarboxylate transporter substrate binding protein [Parapusillimonas granuli]